MTQTPGDRDKNSKGRKQFWSKYLAEKLSVNDIVLRKSSTSRVGRLEDNRYFWRGFFDGDGKGRRR